ncbi:MAG: HNH endonuclease [Cyanobacteria bacterium P01_G01_bin.67]
MNLSPLFDSKKISLIWKENSHEKLIDHPQYGMISPNELRAKFADTPCPHCDTIMKHGESYKTSDQEEAIARKFYYFDSYGHRHFCKIGNVYFSDRYVTLDHKLNKARFPNKMFDVENLEAVCWKCNHIKSDNNLFGILRKRANGRKRRKKLFKNQYL